MPERVNPVDPPDLGLLPTFRRLLRLWRAEWRLGAIGLSLAFVYTLISITIPLLMQQAVDHAIVEHTKPLWPYILAIVGLAGVRFLVNFSRRYATARIGIRIEARMRELLYSRISAIPRAFYDRHATGQVLSRATNDLYPIRYFIGWGLVQGMQSLMMIVSGGIVLVIVNPRLALYTAVAMPPITVLALRFARRVSPLSRKVQERKGDVTEAADEAVVGIEMVQAFGREDDVRGRFGGKAEAVRDTVLEQAGVEARHLPGPLLPAVALDRGRRLLRRPAGDRRPSLDRPVRPLRDAPAPARVAARGARLDHEPRAARARVGRPQLRVARGDRAAARAEGSAAPARRPARRALRGRPLRVRRRGRRAARARPRRSSRARSSRSAARPAPARRRSSTCCRASTTRPAAACSSAASTRAPCRSRSCVPTSRS